MQVSSLRCIRFLTKHSFQDLSSSSSALRSLTNPFSRQLFGGSILNRRGYAWLTNDKKGKLTANQKEA